MTEDQYKQWIILNEELILLCEKVEKRLENILPGNPKAIIIFGFLTKAKKYIQAITLLTEKNLLDSALSIVRSLLEHYFSFKCFQKMLSQNSRDACQRVIDSQTLNMTKQQKAIDYNEHDKTIPNHELQKLRKNENMISVRYEKKELKKIKCHGFTGLSIKEQAESAGCQDIYDYMYRHLSDSVHPGDLICYDPRFFTFIEKSTPKGYNLKIMRRNYFQYYSHFSVGGIVEGINEVFRLGFEKKLIELGTKAKQLYSLVSEKESQ